MSWPAREWICLNCRTLLTDPSCPASARHHTAHLRDADGRERLLSAVWGPKPLRQQILEASKVGAGAAAGSAGYNACNVASVFDLEGFLIVFAVVAVVWFVVALLVGVVKRRRSGRRARGADAPGLQCERARGAVGEIVGAQRADEPLDGVSCVAYAAELRHAGRVMARDAATVGFDVALESGELIRVPAGQLAIDMRAARTARAARLDAYRVEIDPGRASADDLDPLPADEVSVIRLRPGDRVEVLGEFDRIPTAGMPAGYREPAACVLVPRGLARVRPC